MDTFQLIRNGLEHDVPGSCWATGPKTGDPIDDLLACPGCIAIKALDNHEKLYRHSGRLLAICENIAASGCDLKTSERRMTLYDAITMSGGKL